MYNNIKLLRTEEELVMALRAGEVLCLSTGRLYGLIADATNDYAMQKVLSLKMRNVEQKPLPLLFANVRQAKDYVIFNDFALKLVEYFWPGNDLTIILPKICDKVCLSRALSRKAFGFLQTLAIRVPENELLLRLINHLGCPVSGTSANIAGMQVATSYADLDTQLSNYCSSNSSTEHIKIFGLHGQGKELVHDIKQVVKDDDSFLPSTIISFRSVRSDIKITKDSLKILREGSISIAKIKRFMDNF
jgi:L-threonylcarbamoyladenylate synthase